jgi:hypothetical protein
MLAKLSGSPSTPADRLLPAGDPASVELPAELPPGVELIQLHPERSTTIAASGFRRRIIDRYSSAISRDRVRADRWGGGWISIARPRHVDANCAERHPPEKLRA